MLQLVRANNTNTLTVSGLSAVLRGRTWGFCWTEMTETWPRSTHLHAPFVRKTLLFFLAQRVPTISHLKVFSKADQTALLDQCLLFRFCNPLCKGMVNLVCTSCTSAFGTSAFELLIWWFGAFILSFFLFSFS